MDWQLWLGIAITLASIGASMLRIGMLIGKQNYRLEEIEADLRDLKQCVKERQETVSASIQKHDTKIAVVEEKVSAHTRILKAIQEQIGRLRSGIYGRQSRKGDHGSSVHE